MNDKRTIAVVGATGAQGGSLARALLGDPQGRFQARVLTRNIRSDKAQELGRLGAEVVNADLDDLESLQRAFEGAYGAYCLTNFWEHFSPDRELAQATNMAAAAESAGLGHVVWSTLEDTRQWVPLDDARMPTLMDRYKVPHFDAKGEADEAFISRGLPVTFLLTSFYWDNFINLGSGPARGSDGALALTLPMGNAKLAGIAAEDIGKCAFGLFTGGRQNIGRKIGIAGEHLTGAEMAAAFSRVLEEEVRYNDVPPETYRSFDFPGAADLGNMFQFKRDFNAYFCGARDPARARALNPDLQTFDAWLERNKDRLPT